MPSQGNEGIDSECHLHSATSKSIDHIGRSSDPVDDHIERLAEWQVAAIDKPELHLWETGVMRITRHPQAFGQALWCAAHLLWIGSSFMLTTSAALMAHHLFSCWHGDFRLRRKYGEVAHCLCCSCKLGV